MARYDDSQPYMPDYDEDCADCEGEFPRGELAWFGGQFGTDRLICEACETKAMAGKCEACMQPLGDDPDFCDACVSSMLASRTTTTRGDDHGDL